MSPEDAPSPTSSPWVCGHCGRILDHEEGVGYYHSIGDADAGHEAVPVPQAEALVVVGRCDFCYADHPAWVVPAANFEVVPGHMSAGDWAACDGCKDLINANQWSTLVRRAQVGFESRNGPMDPVVVASLPRLYRLLRKNITGSLKPNPALEQQAGRGAARFGRGWKATGSA